MSLREQVQSAIDRIRPAIQMDGGDLELVDVNETDGVVSVALVGACTSCSMSEITLVLGVERTIKDLVPEIKQVIQV